MKSTDATGHGWFSKLIKQFIGTIITVGLTLMGVPIPAAAIIGSAVSTAVNGGTFASFAIGVGIGIAAGYISNAMGVSLFGKTNWEPFIKDPIGMFAAGALQGSIAGAISSAVYGQDIWKGMGYGALGGVIGAGVAISTAATLSFGVSVVKDMASFVLGKGIQAVHLVVQKTVAIAQFIARTAIDIAKNAVELIRSWVTGTFKFPGALFGPWERPTWGGFSVPRPIAQIFNKAAGMLSSDAALNGFHQWHGASMAGIAGEFGPLGGVTGWLGGFVHELDPVAISQELRGQGLVNWAIDSVGDLAANTLGGVAGLISNSMGVGKSWGGIVPGPADPATFTGLGRVYSGDPLDAWRAKYP